MLDRKMQGYAGLGLFNNLAVEENMTEPGLSHSIGRCQMTHTASSECECAVLPGGYTTQTSGHGSRACHFHERGNSRSSRGLRTRRPCKAVAHGDDKSTESGLCCKSTNVRYTVSGGEHSPSRMKSSSPCGHAERIQYPGNHVR